MQLKRLRPAANRVARQRAARERSRLVWLSISISACATQATPSEMQSAGASAGTTAVGAMLPAAGSGEAGSAATRDVSMVDRATSMSGVASVKHPLMGQRRYPRVLYPAENPDAEPKALLGKILFWDEQLSGNDSTACGSCHRGGAGGSDPRSASDAARFAGPDAVLDALPGATSDDGRGSIGVVACDTSGAATATIAQVTGRKAPSAFDAMFSGDLFWDGRASRHFIDPETQAQLITGVLDKQSGRIVGGALESQAVGPPLSVVEMACASPSWERIAAKLARVAPLGLSPSVPSDLLAFIAQRSYPQLFAAAFGAELKNDDQPNDVINARRIAFAIATYERRLTSDHTPWDSWNDGDASALTPQQVQGYELFMGKANCQACHSPPLFFDLTFHYLGLHPIARDPGQGGVAAAGSGHDGMMKTPTLRNVGLREQGGLTHQGDGPGHNLDQLLALYRDGGRRDLLEHASQIDPLLVAIELNDAELAALADFLRHGLTDPRVEHETPPFDRPRLRSEL